MGYVLMQVKCVMAPVIVTQIVRTRMVMENITVKVNSPNGPFLTVNQSMFTKVEVTNQWHCRALNNLCPTLHKTTCAFC